jgi:tetratricopeptide (TPR) repeat protein
VSKRKHKHRFSPPPNPAVTPKQNGLKAFSRNDFSTAIEQWSRLDLETEPAVRSAMAEAHFRRALAARDVEQCLADLTRSTELIPGEGRFWYHLGLAHHRADQIDEALAAYARASEAGFSRKGLSLVRGLAAIEHAPDVDMETQDWLSPTDRLALFPVAALLRGKPQDVLDSKPGNWFDRLKAQVTGNAADPFSLLWRGLALSATGQVAEALTALAPPGQPLKAGAESTRALYHAAALAATGDQAAALAEWTSAATRMPTPRIQAVAANAYLRLARSAAEAGQWQAVLASTQTALKALPGQPALRAVELVAHNRLAGESAERGDWKTAILHWQHMCTALDEDPQLGPITPILHNLAIAHERSEQWEVAAEDWSALLSRLPKRPTKKSQTNLHLPLPVPELRAWVRRRVLDCYKRAGRPDQAITHYRNAAKANPDDLDLRLELADALVANDQIVAGRNELQRILQKDPRHVDAHVRLAEVHLERSELYAAEQELRAALETDPKHAPAQRGLAEILSERGHDQFNAGFYSQAKKSYQEALQLTPDDAQLLVWLGNTELAMTKVAAARERFDTAMTKGDLHTYVAVFGCWAERGNLTEARHIIDRAVAAGVASPHFYVDVAGECFQSMQRSMSPMGFPGAKRAGDNTWERLGREMLQKADVGDANADTLRHIISILGPLQPDIALEYAQKLIRRTPNDPVALMYLGVLQGMIGQRRTAKDNLRKAASLARKQGNHELLEEIEQAREVIDNPLLGMMSQMGIPFDELDDEELYW